MDALTLILIDVREEYPVDAMRDALADMGADLSAILETVDDGFDFEYAGEDFIPFGLNGPQDWQ